MKIFKLASMAKTKKQINKKNGRRFNPARANVTHERC